MSVITTHTLSYIEEKERALLLLTSSSYIECILLSYQALAF